MLTTRSAVAFACLIVFGGVERPGLAADDTAWSSMNRAIPATAQMVVLLEDAHDVAELFRRSEFGTMLASESWKPFLDSLRTERVGCLLNPRPWFGVDWEDVAEVSAPAALFVFSTDTQQPTAALLLDVRDNASQAEALRKKAAAYFQSVQARRMDEAASADKRTVFEFTEKSGLKRQRVSFERDGRLVFVSDKAGADRLAKFWRDDEGAGALGAEADYNSIFEKSASVRGSSIRWWVRPLPLAQKLRRPPPPGRRSSRGDWVASMERLGIEQVRAVGGTIELTPGQLPEWDIKLGVVAPKPYAKAMQMAVLQPGAWRPPTNWVHDSVDFWGTAYRDPTQWFKGLGSVFDEVVDPGSPGAFNDVVEAIKNDPCGPRIDVTNEVVPRLDKMMTQVSDHGGQKNERNPDGRRVMMVLSTAEGRKLAEVFGAMFEGDSAVAREKVRESDIWSTKGGEPLFIAAGQRQRLSVTCLAVASNVVYLSTHKDWLLSVLQGTGEGSPLSKHPRFAAIEAYLENRGGAQASAWGIGMFGGTLRFPYEQIRGGKPNENNEVIRELLELLLFGTSEEIDPKLAALLPDWNEVAPAIGSGAAVISPTPTGFAGYWGIWPEKPSRR